MILGKSSHVGCIFSMSLLMSAVSDARQCRVMALTMFTVYITHHDTWEVFAGRLYLLHLCLDAGCLGCQTVSCNGPHPS